MVVNPTLPIHAKVAIIGAGPVGSWLAITLAKAKQAVLLLEANQLTEITSDTRTLALAWPSIQALEQHGISLDMLEGTPIDAVHVSQQNIEGTTTLTKDDIQLPHLGAVVTYQKLKYMLQQAALSHPSPYLTLLPDHLVSDVHPVGNCAHLVGNHNQNRFFLTADLAILAEGGTSEQMTPFVQKHVHDYHQCALAAEVSFSQPSNTTAYECLSSYGPLALLPYHGHYKLLWTRQTHEADLLYRHQKILVNQLQEAMGDRLGTLQFIRATQLFPLALKSIHKLVKGRIALIGAAAQTLHPIAGQGFNLGLRDAQMLSQCLLQKKRGEDLTQQLIGYAHHRHVDRFSIMALTHFMAKAFEYPQGSWLGSLGINCLDRYPLAKRHFMMHMMFGTYNPFNPPLPL